MNNIKKQKIRIAKKMGKEKEFLLAMKLTLKELTGESLNSIDKRIRRENPNIVR